MIDYRQNSIDINNRIEDYRYLLINLLLFQLLKENEWDMIGFII